jgi:hypothetical protein
MPPDRRALQFEALRDEAGEKGFGTLASVLDCTLIEARYLTEQERNAGAEHEANPSDLWRPVP